MLPFCWEYGQTKAYRHNCSIFINMWSIIIIMSWWNSLNIYRSPIPPGPSPQSTIEATIKTKIISNIFPVSKFLFPYLRPSLSLISESLTAMSFLEILILNKPKLLIRFLHYHQTKTQRQMTLIILSKLQKKASIIYLMWSTPSVSPSFSSWLS